MTFSWSWSDVPGIDAKTRGVARRKRERFEPAAPVAKIVPANALGVWSGNLGDWLSADGVTWGVPYGSWPADEAKLLAETFPRGLIAAAIAQPVAVHA